MFAVTVGVARKSTTSNISAGVLDSNCNIVGDVCIRSTGHNI